ncbi:MAG: hypothetical protein OEV78_01645 [Spirochaetia bacterium]|nr:hypothetical protein [Spirochaetia bacterium]
MNKLIHKFLQFIFFIHAAVFIFAGFSSASHNHHKIKSDNKLHKDCQICIFSLNNFTDDSRPPRINKKLLPCEIFVFHTINIINYPLIYTNNQPHAPPLVMV